MLPALNGIITRIGLAGQLCARLTRASVGVMAAAAMSRWWRRVCFKDVPLSSGTNRKLRCLLCDAACPLAEKYHNRSRSENPAAMLAEAVGGDFAPVRPTGKFYWQPGDIEFADRLVPHPPDGSALTQMH